MKATMLAGDGVPADPGFISSAGPSVPPACLTCSVAGPRGPLETDGEGDEFTKRYTHKFRPPSCQRYSPLLLRRPVLMRSSTRSARRTPPPTGYAAGPTRMSPRPTSKGLTGPYRVR